MAMDEYLLHLSTENPNQNSENIDLSLFFYYNTNKREVIPVLYIERGKEYDEQ